MTEERRVLHELIIAIGYALDASDDKKELGHRNDCRDKAETILIKCILILKEDIK